ncbi:MAG: family 10 glycosylhydrolase, partial [Myxococcales bacterium]|nr:family 10 glycosylhydrolase [Myxococcales bacterium]
KKNGVWIATVSNINFPSRTGLSADAQKAELDALVATTAAAGLNAIVFQVRPECDALYRSNLEPWSRYLTGTQGQDPGYDPLEYLLEVAHARAVEVHAWLNPYRAKASAGSTAVAPHLSVTVPEHAHRYGNFLWMDPGAAEVQDALLAVVEDLVTRYDLDGVHFDDYFYPYPDGATAFPDDTTFAAYQASGGALGRDDWRRDNVNRMVEAVNATVLRANPHVRFGISPFGIYRPGMPEGITGLDQYAAIFSDPPVWMQEGWVDYLAPQLYWPSTQTRQAYGPLVSWWSALAHDGRVIIPGNYLSQLGSSSAWTVDELRTQVALTRAEAPADAAGNIYFHIGPLQENRSGIADVFKDELYATPALPPELPGRAEAAPPPPVVALEGTRATLSAGGPEVLRAWVLYRDAGAGWAVQDILPASTTSVELSTGRWAISAADRGSRESLGVVVDVP